MRLPQGELSPSMLLWQGDRRPVDAWLERKDSRIQGFEN
jgi:hypothetical protein